MKLPYSWLAELVNDIPNPNDLSHLLTMLGFEVEEIIALGEGIRDVVVGQIEEKEAHPDADKLSYCQVTDGSKTYPIVCGASNMKAGDFVALARVGSTLPGDFKIEKRKIRGVTSEGMMCSTREMGLGEDHAGIMILDGKPELGQPLADVLGLNDVVFDLNITPNRPDTLCAIGIAREIAAHCGTSLNLPDTSPIEADVESAYTPRVELIDEDLCHRYTALVIKDIKVGPSPDWLKTRLESCGVRSVNNVVDATNLVLLETGQPLHAFDLHKLNEERIVVRKAKAGEHLVCIDGDDRKLTEDMLAIADAKNPVAVGGVMGGLDSEVGNDTADILLESAYFYPPSIRRTSKTLQLSSDASYRFERGVDLETVIPASYRCARLIKELAGGNIAGTMAVADTQNAETLAALRGRVVELRYEYCNRLLGKPIAPDTIENLLTSLHFSVESKNDETIVVKVPSFRNDVHRAADLVEEVARCTGYGEFEPTLPKAPVKAPEPMEVDRKFVERIRNHLCSAGLDEAVTYNFTNKQSLELFPTEGADLDHDIVTIQNALVSGEETMRTSLLPCLLVCAKRNVAHGNMDFGLFEIAKKFLVKDGREEERKMLAGVLAGNPHRNWRDSRKEQDFFEAKGIVEEILQIAGCSGYRAMDPPDCLHPKRGITIQIGKDIVGYYGELQPVLAEKYDLSGRILVFELEMKILSDRFRCSTKQYKPFSTYPAIKRDMALLIPEHVTAEHIEKIIRNESGKLLEDVSIFDYYKGKQVQEGYASVAFRLTFRSREETLKEEAVDKTFEKVVNQLKNKLDVQLRS